MTRFKVADAPNSILPPHQDAPYNAHLNDFLTVWVPLVEIDNDCGGLIVYDGSHTAELVDHVSSGAWEAKATGDHSRFHTQHVLMKPGDILMFPPALLHESAPHRSARVRYSIDFRVVRSAGDTTKSFFDPFTGAVTQTD
jgi:ectoine hydroxylase-related dioxygenase (phytanoyl-CoA dioxygenase family)